MVPTGRGRASTCSFGDGRTYASVSKGAPLIGPGKTMAFVSSRTRSWDASFRQAKHPQMPKCPPSRRTGSPYKWVLQTCAAPLRGVFGRSGSADRNRGTPGGLESAADGGRDRRG